MRGIWRLASLWRALLSRKVCDCEGRGEYCFSEVVESELGSCLADHFPSELRLQLLEEAFFLKRVTHILDRFNFLF